MRSRVLCLLLALLGVADLPLFAANGESKCPAPSPLARQLANHPSAAAYDRLGAYFGQNDAFSCAVAAFRASLRLAPGSAETHYYLGLALLATRNNHEAAEELRIALKLRPDLPQAHWNLAVALSQGNQLDAAVEEFYIALQEDPKSVTVLDWLAKSLIAEKRYPEAISLLSQAPADETLQMDLVMAYSQSGNNAPALQLLLEMAKQRPQSPLPHSGLATIYTQQRRYQEAAAEFKEALRLRPDDDLACMSYVKVLILLAQFETALPVLEEYRRRHSLAFEALYLTGVVDRELGDYAEAKHMLSQAMRLNPNHYDVRYNLGVVLAQSGEPAPARAQLERALELDPTSRDARFQLAAVLRSLGLPAEARKQLEQYQRDTRAQAEKDVAATKSNQASEYLKQGDMQKAIALYREAIQETPNSHMLYDLAMALDQSGDFEGERDALEKAILADPSFAQAHNQLGYVVLEEGKTAQAEKEFKTALSLNPHYAEAQNNLGVLYGQRGNDGEAERWFRQAIQSNPAYVQALVNLSATLASESRFAEADTWIKNALRIEPDNQEGHEVQAMIEAQLGDRAQTAK
jgi:tetratricopeptide (TPR) repeat protein